MRRTQWAVFTSMNPRPSAWRALYEPAAPAEPVSTREKQDDAPGAAAVEPAEERTVAGYE